jgi:hypothetical protein
MSSPAYILEECETALLNYLSSSIADPDFSYYKGMDTMSEKETPSIIVQATQCDEDFIGSGVWHVGIRTYFVYPFEGSGSLDTRHGKYQTFTEKLYVSMSLAAVTSSVSHLNLYDIYGKGIANSVQQDHWVSENEFEFVAVYK